METVQERRIVVGDVVASRRANVATQESGVVIDMPVEEGQRVQKGEVLAKLDSLRLKLQMSQAEADLLAAEALVVERTAEKSNADTDVQVIRNSFEKGGANAKELRDAEATLKVAVARVSAAARQADAVKARIDLLEHRLADTSITAPFDGAVIACHVEIGEWVSDGDSVVQMVALDPVEVWLNVPQRFFEAVRNGRDPVVIQTDTNGRLYESQMGRVVPNVDPKSRAFMLVAILENPEQELLPGASVTGWIPTGKRGDHLTISKNALLQNETGFYIYVARSTSPQQPSTAVPIAVELQFPVKDRLVVRAPGLTEGDQAVTEGNERLFPMAPIKLVNPEQMRASSAEDGP